MAALSVTLATLRISKDAAEIGHVKGVPPFRDVDVEIRKLAVRRNAVEDDLRCGAPVRSGIDSVDGHERLEGDGSRLRIDAIDPPLRATPD